MLTSTAPQSRKSAEHVHHQIERGRGLVVVAAVADAPGVVVVVEIHPRSPDHQTDLARAYAHEPACTLASQSQFPEFEAGVEEYAVAVATHVVHVHVRAHSTHSRSNAQDSQVHVRLRRY